MCQLESTSYDEVPYESYPFAQTHPDRLATVATLLGMSPPPVDHCRVLELGCASGGNLLPMAQNLPNSSFMGIDFSEREVAEGRKMAEALGLRNVELRRLNILSVNEGFGRFDYIICHGVYSWVASPVQDKILEICASNLSPNGVAYVSYNTYPGWHMRGMIRDMMSYHAQQFREPLVRVKQARNLLDFLAKSVAQENTPYSLLLKSELESLSQCRDSYLFHEHLEEVNDPIYFHQFAERALARGLRYLGDVDLHLMVPGNYPRNVENVLQMLSPDLIHMEQYMDFLRNRMFRQTLLCHKAFSPTYRLTPEQVTGFLVASPAKPMAAKPDLSSTAVEQFQGPDGFTLSSSDPLVKAAMAYLAEAWPMPVPFGEVRARARARLLGVANPDPATTVEDTQHLGKCLLSFYTSSSRLVELHVHAPPLVKEISEYPIASPLARLQAVSGNTVCNLRHELTVLSEFERQLLRLLDGRHNRASLQQELAQLVTQGVLRVEHRGEVVRESGKVLKLLGTALEEQLPKLAQNALLVG
jgi:methyltransferase-like protein/2-polyprenyl-3-methyl-5-hydroxy-6-metoxy-1,4-benzoquinol methylase